jgi:hypothetical protein
VEAYSSSIFIIRRSALKLKSLGKVIAVIAFDEEAKTAEEAPK